MNINSAFLEFAENVKPQNIDDLEKSVSGINRCLNKEYYGDTENHSLIVGSFGRKTAIKNSSDIDVLYILPDSIFGKYDAYESNGQSALLQDIKNILLNKYSRTDIKGDGQVVDVLFDAYTIEVVPVFKDSSGKFKYPDTHNGGSWKYSNPIAEINTCETFNNDYKCFRDLCRIIRCWRSEESVKINGILIDTLCHDFLLSNFKYYNKERTSIDWKHLYFDFLEYMSRQDDSEYAHWFALGSYDEILNKKFNFVKKSKKDKEVLEDCNDDDEVWDTIKAQLGKDFPANPNIYEKNATNNEQFPEDLFTMNCIYKVKIDCDVIQDGFRTFLLSELNSGKFLSKFLKHKKKLLFKIVQTDVPEPYDVYWKVKNVGSEAIKRNQIRGNIIKGEKTKEEKTSFNGPHYVECFIVKNGCCLARNKIKVPIKDF